MKDKNMRSVATTTTTPMPSGGGDDGTDSRTRTSRSTRTTEAASAPVSAPAPAPSPFLTPQQLATRWQCSVVKLRRMRKAWTLPAHTVGSHIRFMLADIEKLEAGWRTGTHVGASTSTTSTTQEAEAQAK